MLVEFPTSPIDFAFITTGSENGGKERRVKMDSPKRREGGLQIISLSLYRDEKVCFLSL